MPFLITALGLLLAAAPLSAMKVGRISLLKTSGGDLLRIQTDSLAAPAIQTADGKLVIVVPGGERSLKTLELQSGPVARIRFGMEGSDLHIVLDLKAKMHGSLRAVTAQGFGVFLAPYAAGHARAPAPASAAAADASGLADLSPTAMENLDPAQAGYTYRVVDFSVSGDERHCELVVSADGPANYASSVLEDGRLLRVDFHNSSLAWSGDVKSLRDDAIVGVDVKQLLVDGESHVRVDIHLTGKLDYAFKRDQNQLVVRLDRPSKPEVAATTGDFDAPVSLDVQGADLVGVLKTLCEQAGFDYQFTRTLLTKTPPESLVSMKVDGRPFHEVVDTLLAQVQCREVRLGNTIYMGSQMEIDTRRDRLPMVSRTYTPKYLTIKQISQYLALHYAYDDAEKARLKNIVVDPRDPSSVLLVGTGEEVAGWEAFIRQIDVPEAGDSDDGGDEGNGQMRTQVFHLQYLDSSNSGLINGAIAQLFPEGETPPTPLLDSSTRTLVLTTRPKYLRMIGKLLTKIDIRPWEVNIEGRIVEVDQSVASQLGINWSSQSIGSNPNVASAFNANATNPFTSQLTYGTIFEGANIAAQIQALVQTNKADLVSAPNITTIDNQPATISATQVQVYVQTTTTISNGVVTNANTFPTSNVPLTLVVTPKISRPDRRITMNINFQLTSINGSAPASGAPLPTNQQSAVTNVTVDSGNTFVIGGLVKQNNTEQVSKVPILGDIPLLGLLFKYSSINKSKSEVIIFIKPTIVAN
jgi:hypothetical protein